MKKVQNKGFTIIELIFVLVILAIIFAILVATYPGLTQNLKVKTDRASAKNVANALRTWYVDNSTDALLTDDLRDFIEDSGIKDRTIMINEIPGIEKYVDTSGNKPISLLNANKVTEPIQNFLVGLIDTKSDVRIVISVGIEDGIDISGIEPDTASDVIATYNGYSSGIIYVEPKR